MMYRNNKGSLQIDKRKSGSMISRDEFLERMNREGFSFSIEIPRRSFSDFTSLVRRRRISEEDLYQLFYNYCHRLKVYHLIETVNGRRKKTPMEILMDLVDAL